MADVFKVEGKVSLDTSSFNSEVDKASQAGKKLSSDLNEQSSGIKKSLENAFSVSIGNIFSDIAQETARYMLDFAKESVSIASSLQEVQNVVDVTFGDGANQLEQWAKGARTQFGLTELQAKQYASTMGAMLKSMGMTETQAYDMSTAMAGLAADMASFYDIDFDEAFSKIRSGISGETEPLKQLGINLNVANLEAYALSRGITKTYESMTLAEQATLRYNYLMNATADAQGDFARTSDSYANNLRLAETNINSLKASIGEGLLPVVNDAVSLFNSFFEDGRSLSERMADADVAFESSAETIAMNTIRANSLIDTLDKLSKKESLTTQETAQWEETVRLITEIYPSLGNMIGNTAGEFATSAESIRNETESLKENALEKAKIIALQEKVNSWASAAAAAGVAEAKYKDSYTQWRVVADEVEATQEFFAGLTDEELLNYDTEGFLKLVEKESQLSAQTVELEKNWASLNEQVAEAETEMRSAEETLAELNYTAEGTNDNLSGGGGVVDGMADMADNTIELKSSLEDLLKEGENVQKMFDELEQYKLDNFNSIQKKVEGVYGTFDKADKVKKTTSKKMFSNLDSQIEQADRFQEAYKTLQEMGANDTLMSQFDYSPESIAQMEALIKSGADGIATATEKIEELKTKESEITTSLSETALNVDTEFQNMVSKAETASAELTAKYQTIVEQAATMQATVTTGADTATGAVTELQSAGDELGLSEWEPTIDAQDNATRVINSIEAALNKLDGKTITTYVNIVQNGSLPGHADGLDYVPYDNYVARLHEGEAVLTKKEASQWRSGSEKTKEEQPITVNLTVNGVSSNPYEIAGEVKNALELMRWQE